MTGNIRVDSGDGAGVLPSDRLGTEELSELRRLMAQWEHHDGLARQAKERVQLLLLVAKDRRGILGPVEVEPNEGIILRLGKGVSNG